MGQNNCDDTVVLGWNKCRAFFTSSWDARHREWSRSNSLYGSRSASCACADVVSPTVATINGRARARARGKRQGKGRWARGHLQLRLRLWLTLLRGSAGGEIVVATLLIHSGG